MKRFTTFACLALTLVFAMNAFASDLPQRVDGHDGVITGGNADFAKSSRDTLFLIGPNGSGAAVNGEFEDLSGNPTWNGWTSYDITQPTVSHYHISDYNADTLPGGIGNLAAYCGDETIEACAEDDVIGGYGNSWHDILRFEYTVVDNSIGSTIVVNGVMNHDSEPGYDKVFLGFNTADGFQEMSVYDGTAVAYAFTETYSYVTATYVGPTQDIVQFDVMFKSDGGWSDGDCSFYGAGAVQVDDLHVTISNGVEIYNATTDFEDGTFGDWEIAYPVGAGDFAGLWFGLEDADPCTSNYTAQVAFIDDGTQVFGVGPSYCTNWCYGPGGYIANTMGGAADDGILHNAIESPVVTWPGSSYTGSELEFGVYRHEDLSFDAPGMFYTWGVRSTVDEVVSPIADAEWKDRNFVYYGGPDYVRAGDVVSDLFGAGITHAQVQLTVYELGWAWGWTGDDGYPAPYFDNVRLTAYVGYGPGMATRDINIANDNFSEIGVEVDFANLANNHVRFDMAQSPALAIEENNIPGDSLTCDVAVLRTGGVLVSNKLVYTMLRNPVFDGVRDAAWGISGSVDGVEMVNGVYAYDLPDTGFMFPGDIVHYYFEATDEVGGGSPETATVPIDIAGFGNFDDPLAYDTVFQVHALPSVKADQSQPSILFWNDFGDRGGENEWFGAFANLGLTMGVDYDVYVTNGPSSGVGNGIGGRASGQQLNGYSELLYTSGDLSQPTISNGDYTKDGGDDIGVINSWIASGDRDAFFTGDELVSNMASSGIETSLFVADYFNVILRSDDVRSLINSQTTPAVIPTLSNPVFTTTPGWIAYGGCLGINTFDAVEAGLNAVRLAEFLSPSGGSDYAYSAATLNINAGDRIITMPYDFMNIYTDADNLVSPTYGLATRVNVLAEILGYFNVDGSGWVASDVTPDAGKFFASNYPNPFNPTTKIMFNMPKEGHLSLKIYNVRGELVNTLIDESRVAGEGHIMWDGTNSQGSNVSSGVYFYEARTAGNVVVNKMALVK